MSLPIARLTSLLSLLGLSKSISKGALRNILFLAAAKPMVAISFKFSLWGFVVETGLVMHNLCTGPEIHVPVVAGFCPL
jgi:hypothetical protein